MKRLLKVLLIPCFMLAGIYAATPLWLPYFLAGQLPQGWQLEELQSGYPGLTGIDIHLMRVDGELKAADIALTSSDLRFTYRGLISDIDQVSLDVFVRARSSKSADSLSLDELTLPVTNLTGKLPRLSIRQLNMAVHLENGLPTFIASAARPLLFEFNNVDLVPRTEQSFHLASRVVVAESLRPEGRLDVDVAPGLTSVNITFPSGANQLPWLVLEIVQEGLAGETTTDFQAVLDSKHANRNWLDSLLAGSSKRIFGQLEGKVEIKAGFSGKELQGIENFSVISNDLQLVSDTGKLDLDANLLAGRDGEKIVIKLMKPAKIVYQGNAAWFDERFTRAVPGLQLPARSEVTIVSEIDSGSRIEILPGEAPSASFNGEIDVELRSGGEQLNVSSDSLQMEMQDIYMPGPITADGSFKIDWNVSGPVSYTSENVKLDASRMSISTDLVVSAGELISSGDGTFLQARLTPQSAFAERIEMDWQNLDPIQLTGKLATRTRGFSTEFNDEVWKGFDFDINYTLLNGADISGSGTVKTTGGTDFPIEFEGSLETQRWNARLIPSRIPLAKLRKLLTIAHYDLPAAIKLADGLIELQGDIVLDGDIKASMLINGSDMDVSMFKSRARNSSFMLDAGYDRAMWARGPVTIESVDLAGGIDVRNIRSVVEIDHTKQVGLKNLHAELFDGQVELGSLQFSENRIEDTVLDFSHINFGSLLKYADIDGLEGTGFLDISLPVGSDQTGIHVKNGTFSSTGPGRLVYKKEGMAGSNIGLQALENFQYKELSGTLNYQSDGSYLMTVRLEGKNPELYGGHPVVFNLNVNGSLPALFEAMFRTGSFEEAILKEINRQ